MSLEQPHHRHGEPSASGAPADSPRNPVLLGLALALATAGIAFALATSEISGTGASDVGSSVTPAAQAPPAPGASDGPPGGRPGADAQTSGRRDCEATESNPGGDNNYIPDAPARASLGDGFVITGRVGSAEGCRPLAGVPIQVWLATATGAETDNRATVRTGEDGRYRIETAPTVPQFGEPNIHVAYGGERFEQVFFRRVVDLDDTHATVNLTLARDG
ncbi:MAG: hypothetical protein LC790_15720 [Actinobacteria bacterium]|nr:hypothetical protein [Actinomycetota bacterium]